jgi:hypothetical protein
MLINSKKASNEVRDTTSIYKTNNFTTQLGKRYIVNHYANGFRDLTEDQIKNIFEILHIEKQSKQHIVY